MMSNQKAAKMCKSPKSLVSLGEKIEYEHLNTNCTIVGSNNLHLVKKPQLQQQHVMGHGGGGGGGGAAGVSPAYSNPSPGYHSQSPYSSPASSLKSPSPQLNNTMKPPTPQPNTFPVMQIINPVIARPIQATTQQQNVIKLKPPLNILPKPSASPQQSPKPSVSPQIVLPTNQPTSIMQTQPLLLNQMPMLAAAPGVQFILRPQTTTTAKIAPQVQHTQPLILQPGGQQLLQLQTSPRGTQNMVRVLTNGVGLQPATATTYLTTQVAAQPVPSPQQHIAPPNGASPKKKPPPVKKKKQKLDLANIMKLSGIGDDDDVQFESDTSQSESEGQQQQQQQQHHHHQQHHELKKVVGTTSQPLMQVLNHQTFQGHAGTAGQIPYSPFITPNFTINNGLMVQQRTGGFKLAVGEDGRFVLQHDPTLNQDLQSQLLLQSIFGLNGSLVLQPSIDQQIHSQTVQTIQQQSVQTIQQQTVQSQTIQTVQHQIVQPQTLQSIQSQIQGQLQNLLQQQQQQQPASIQGIALNAAALQSLQSGQLLQQQQLQQQQQHNVIVSRPTVVTTGAVAATSVGSSGTFTSTASHQPQVLKVQPFQKSQPPVQTVHPIHHHHHQQQQQQQQQQQATNGSATPAAANPPTSYVVNLTPDQLEQLKRNGQLTVNGQTIFMQRPTAAAVAAAQKDDNKINGKQLSPPKIKPLKKTVAKVAAAAAIKEQVKDCRKEVQTAKVKSVQPIVVQNNVKLVNSKNKENGPLRTADVAEAEDVVKPVVTSSATPVTESSASVAVGGQQQQQQQQQRVHTIQLTPQKQQHLKSIQLQIQTLSSRMQPGNVEMQTALKMLFQEQQKILASGKLLSPDKVYYHNNQLIVNNSAIVKNNEVLSQQQQLQLHQQQQKDPAVVCSSNGTAPVAAVAAAVSSAGAAVAAAVAGGAVPPVAIPTVANNVAVVVTESQQSKVSPIVHQVQSAIKVEPGVKCLPDGQLQQQQQQQPLRKTPTPKPMPLSTKAQLIEQQMNTDQNGALKPDVHTPFKDKADACKRLIRYHCFEQPILSEKDLFKADEIFELTAKHFIDKFERMVDKYRFLLHKESQRQVQTSELMMLDRMFLSEEQQSLMQLRQEIEEYNQNLEMQQQQPAPSDEQEKSATLTNAMLQQQNNSDEIEDYDEWACIQRELGYMPLAEDMKNHQLMQQQQQQHFNQQHHLAGIKRSSSGSTSGAFPCGAETLKKLRIECSTSSSSSSMKTSAALVSAFNGTTAVSQRNFVQHQQQQQQQQVMVNQVNRQQFSLHQLQQQQQQQQQRIVSSSSSCSTSSSSSSIVVQQHYQTTSHHHQQQQHLVLNSSSSSSCVSTATTSICRTSNQLQQQQLPHHQQPHELDNNDSIDEQVQSAIDSILNLQQTTNSLDLDETMQNMLS